MECNNLNIHVHCFPTLPPTVKHRDHVHVLSLANSPIVDKDEYFFCDACSDNIDLCELSYYCDSCHYVAHVYYAFPEIKAKDRRNPNLSSSDSFPEYRPIPILSSQSVDSTLPKPAPQNPPIPLLDFSKPASSSSSFSSQIGQILGKPYVDITQLYDLDKELRRDQFGITYLCTEKATGLKYACKSISRRKLVTQKDIEDVRREIDIQKHLSGQPNIVEFNGAYEDRKNLYLVMELCSDGELFDRITEKGSYSEKEAARVGRQIVNVVCACHFMGVMHWDLKPENLLLVCRDEDAPLKAIDSGLSVFIEEGSGGLAAAGGGGQRSCRDAKRRKSEFG
ncbi:Calcium-dependent protein kinase 29 [Camellia lanceoleosa]|uniref:Calcium-dependent protein kinase 29 n=1 Tax=Camellia lanceoleosa TaxID=1840588 RepID=A0ACC0F4F1_9ERIC|nr:Calcium-dependent protein kinase 29 [Camellia lanceoleosa]